MELVRGKFNSIKEFMEAISEISKKQSTLVIGIDGCGGSGKSTFAVTLK